MRRVFFNFFIFSILTIFNGCDNGWDFEIPGCMNSSAINYDSNATNDNGSCYFDENENQYINTIDIDASDYNSWVYFSLSNGIIVDIIEPESSLNWDLAFKRNHIKTNGGLSGGGEVCSILDDSEIWTINEFENLNSIPGNQCEEDQIVEGDIFEYEGCYNNMTHIFESCIKNPALDEWGYFDDSYTFNVTNYRFFVRDLDGDFVKVWISSYYDTNGESGKISFSYLYIVQ